MDMMKKIFVIAPHFPPSALPPAQRARLLVKNFKELGFYPYVFTSDPKYREETEDLWMTELVGNDFELFIVKTINPKTTRKFGVGDLGLRMLPALYKELIKKSKELKPDFILYLVPPWYLLTIAKKVKKKTKIPYGIDFIDPWVVPASPNDSFKKKLSQRIARIFEKRATQNADVIYSVSEGINDNLVKNHSLPESKSLFAIPYGVEMTDYSLKVQKEVSQNVTVRYIGAVWKDAYPVLETFLKALSIVKDRFPLKIEFYGTSYAGEGLAKSQTGKWIESFNMNEYMTEDPLRVPYKRAVELTLNADIILLFGGMQPYYAASKLMGLVASKKAFIAFLHEDSFPAKFLSELNYPFVVTYSAVNTPEKNTEILVGKITELIENIDNFFEFDFDNPLIKKHTALGMTQEFVNPIIKILNN